MAAARAVDGEVRQVAGVGAGRVVEPVLCAERVVVAAGRRERRTDALADRMQVDPVEAGRQPLDLDVDVELAGGVLGEPRPADRLHRPIDEAGVGVDRAAGGGHRRPSGPASASPTSGTASRCRERW